MNSRRFSHPAGLFERMGQPDQLRVAECAAHERNADRQANDVSRRHRDARVAGDRGWRGTRYAGRHIAVDVVGEPGWSPGRRDERVETVGFERVVDAVL